MNRVAKFELKGPVPPWLSILLLITAVHEQRGPLPPWLSLCPPQHRSLANYKTASSLLPIDGHSTLQKYRGTGTRYFAKISTAAKIN